MPKKSKPTWFIKTYIPPEEVEHPMVNVYDREGNPVAHLGQDRDWSLAQAMEDVESMYKRWDVVIITASKSGLAGGAPIVATTLVAIIHRGRK